MSITKTIDCWKCGGGGNIQWLFATAKGICFECEGSGQLKIPIDDYRSNAEHRAHWACFVVLEEYGASVLSGDPCPSVGDYSLSAACEKLSDLNDPGAAAKILNGLRTDTAGPEMTSRNRRLMVGANAKAVSLIVEFGRADH